MARQSVLEQRAYSVADLLPDDAMADSTSGWVILQPRIREFLEPHFSLDAVMEWKEFPPERGRYILEGFYQTRAEAEARLKVLYRLYENKRSAPRSWSARLRYLVMQRDGFRCQLCGATAKDGARLEVDHIYPRHAGGGHSMDNLRTLCALCNRGKSGSIEEEQP